MTQPSLTKTFDTSLIDLSAQTSFSTESASSETPAPLPIQSPKFEEASTTRRKMPTRYVPTVEAYDAWAAVYDCDGNVLQAVDDYELRKGGLMKDFCSEVLKQSKKGLRLVDLGCGTGRNTILLMEQEWPEIEVVGIDASAGMLERAGKKFANGGKRVRLMKHNFLDPRDATLPPVLLEKEELFDGLTTTLVLEHFPLTTFFQAIRSLVKINGIVLLTNMHRDMGMQSQAGFVSQDEQGKAIKVRGTSWVHETRETVEKARESGFEVLGKARERSITEGMVGEGIVSERGRKWVGVNVWYGMLLRRVE